MKKNLTKESKEEESEDEEKLTKESKEEESEDEEKLTKESKEEESEDEEKLTKESKEEESEDEEKLTKESKEEESEDEEKLTKESKEEESEDEEKLTKESKEEIKESEDEESEDEEELTKESEEEIIIQPKSKAKSKKQIETKNETNVINRETAITNMKLQYPNPFSARLEERMPQLFVKTKGEKFDAYTRMCPFSLSNRRQPIILTKEEKDKIIKNNPDDIDEQADFIEYGTDSTDSSKKFYYTCPRYWCLLTDTAVTEKDILDGKCGPKVSKVEDAVIPKKEKTVPKGKYVYQFYDSNEKKYPGFHKEKTPSGLCIPCCYSNWSTTEMKNRRDICQGKLDKNKGEKVSKEEEELERQMSELENYVKGPEKYGPQLGEYRWGFLPIALQKFLHEVNDECKSSQTGMNLKFNHTCILRHGVEVSSTQSFIACIASALFFGQKDFSSKEKIKPPLLNKYIPGVKYDVPSIKEMKEILINSLNIDNFITLQNGDLVSSFADENREIDIEKYKSSKLYKKVKFTKENNDDNNDNSDKKFVIKVSQAFENFKDFLRDNKITIDYTYLWDLVCIPNPSLFEAGINLIILEIPEDDTTKQY